MGRAPAKITVLWPSGPQFVLHVSAFHVFQGDGTGFVAYKWKDHDVFFEIVTPDPLPRMRSPDLARHIQPDQVCEPEWSVAPWQSWRQR